jgi:uncharacterized repeat protein (TIGR03803 family)
MVFQLRPPLTFCRSVSCPWTENVLYFFAGVPDGGFPSGGLVFDQAGNLYGTTDIGGNFGGILYELTRSGSAWTESIIHEFSGSDGYFPFGGLISDNAGNLYGAAQEGGLFGQGSIFQFTHSESGWTQSLPYIFHGENDGRDPNACLVFDQAGNLYGTSSDGGSGGGGTVFELSPAGGGWTYSLLYSFTGSRTLSCPNPGNQSGGPGPWAPLVMDGAGNLYGTTLCDGSHRFGSIFKLTPTSGGGTTRRCTTSPAARMGHIRSAARRWTRAIIFTAPRPAAALRDTASSGRSHHRRPSSPTVGISPTRNRHYTHAGLPDTESGGARNEITCYQLLPAILSVAVKKGRDRGQPQYSPACLKDPEANFAS